MKKIILLLVICCILTGCYGNQSGNIVKEFRKQFDKSSGYQLKGDLSVRNNDEVYDYEVVVSYQKEDLYRVELTNKANEHTQVILKNDEGVYVLTPALNKSFRFQSDWPYHNSQIYLLDALLRDLEEDKERSFEKKDHTYIFKTKTHYPNNVRLATQKVVLSKDLKPEKIIVYDQDGVESMSMTFDQVKYSPKLDKDLFTTDSIMEESSYTEQATSSLEDIIYPLFVPAGTKLVGEEKVSKVDGERVIMNYDGEKSFLLVEETADVFEEFTVIPTSGEPYFLMDTLGVMTDNSLSWTTGGVEFYLVSDVMSMDELVEVAQSITGIVSMK